jgi:hypothetical protein
MSQRRKNSEKRLAEVLRFLKKDYDLNPTEILHLIKDKEQQKKQAEALYIPVSLFTASKLSSLETIVRFLRDTKGLKFTEMARVLGRDQRALSTTYRNAKKKNPYSIKIQNTKFPIPCNIIANKELSVLEHIVFYLKHEYKLSNAAIATALNKDPRTIWTVLNRIRKKRGKI